jgi:hypothetical protein
MSTHTPTSVTALAAQAAANQFLSERLPDRFTADQAERDRAGDVWRVPVVLAYPFIGAVGQVGEILVNADTESVVWFTPLDEMRERARLLYEAHRDEIEAAFS